MVLEGPPADRIPTSSDGLYQLLLRIEASDDKEGDSNLASAGAGTGVVHSAAVAGFPMPTLRYYVGGLGEGVGPAPGLALLSADAGSDLRPRRHGLLLAAGARRHALPPRGADGQEKSVLAAVVQQGIGSYKAPGWLRDRLSQAAPGDFRWRVVAPGPGREAPGQDRVGAS